MCVMLHIFILMQTHALQSTCNIYAIDLIICAMAVMTYLVD